MLFYKIKNEQQLLAAAFQKLYQQEENLTQLTTKLREAQTTNQTISKLALEANQFWQKVQHLEKSLVDKQKASHDIFKRIQILQSSTGASSNETQLRKQDIAGFTSKITHMQTEQAKIQEAVQQREKDFAFLMSQVYKLNVQQGSNGKYTKSSWDTIETTGGNVYELMSGFQKLQQDLQQSVSIDLCINQLDSLISQAHNLHEQQESNGKVVRDLWNSIKQMDVAVQALMSQIQKLQQDLEQNKSKVQITLQQQLLSAQEIATQLQQYIQQEETQQEELKQLEETLTQISQQEEQEAPNLDQDITAALGAPGKAWCF